MRLVELQVNGAGKLRLGAGGDDLRVETLLQLGHRGKDALDVQQHHLDRPGEDRQLLLEEIAGHRNAVPHENLVGRAADAGQIDAFCALGPGLGEQLRILVAATSTSERVGSWPWTMMFTSSAFSTPRFARDRSGLGSPNRMSETSVAIIEPPQPSASAVRAAAISRCSASSSPPTWVDMDARDHLPVDAAGLGPFRLPVLLLLFGGAADVRQEAVLAAELGQQEAGQRLWPLRCRSGHRGGCRIRRPGLAAGSGL